MFLWHLSKLETWKGSIANKCNFSSVDISPTRPKKVHTFIYEWDKNPENIQNLQKYLLKNIQPLLVPCLLISSISFYLYCVIQRTLQLFPLTILWCQCILFVSVCTVGSSGPDGNNSHKCPNSNLTQHVNFMTLLYFLLKLNLCVGWENLGRCK